MIKSFFYIFNNYYYDKNFLNLSTIIKPDVTDLKFIEPEKIYDKINEDSTQKNIAVELKDYKGIYGFFCTINKKIYIGSSENLVKRFKEHIKGKKSNIYLQNAINEYGLDNFYYIIGMERTLLCYLISKLNIFLILGQSIYIILSL